MGDKPNEKLWYKNLSFSIWKQDGASDNRPKVSFQKSLGKGNKPYQIKFWYSDLNVLHKMLGIWLIKHKEFDKPVVVGDGKEDIKYIEEK